MPPLIPAKARRPLPWVFLAAVLTGLGIVLSLFWLDHQHVKPQARRESPVMVILNETRSAELGIALHVVPEETENFLHIPREALQQDESGPFVWVEDFDRKCFYLKARVQLGQEKGRLVQITGGLFPGDSVVSSGAAKLRDEPSIQINHPSTKCDGWSYRPSLYERMVRSIKKYLP